MSVPFGERGGVARGVVDLVCGRLPRFLFGATVGSSIPVFHFHNETRDDLAPKFRYLRENGYTTLGADALADVARGRRPVGSREVALCFDDAWATVWTDAAPLLREYRLTAIVYPIPGRVADAAAARQLQQAAGTVDSPFMTWPELRALQSEGVIDVQSHTWLHARIFTSATVVDFVRPGYDQVPPLNRPLLDRTPAVRFLDPDELGAPIFEHRSRMSDGPRVQLPTDAHAACVAVVRQEGGAAFFTRPDWRQRLEQTVAPFTRATSVESTNDQTRAIEEELDRSRSELSIRLGAPIRHVCLPWGVSGAITLGALGRLGFVSAVANRWTGTFAVSPGDDPFWLKRLHNRFVFSLPGHGRRTILTQVLAR